MRNLSRVFLRCLNSLLIIIFLLQLFAPLVSAQSQPEALPQSQTFTKPNVEENVPLNQHTYVQSMFLELMIAIQCQLTGIDITSPTKSCLGINLQTGKLGYAPTESYKNGDLPIGGVMGMLNNSIGSMYTPAFGSQDYFRYVASNFGIAKPALAAPYTGFEGLSPILGLWKATRDIAYYMLIIAFIFIGIGVMLRLKIDPRTVMTVQNQIPRVIICIILITFSYAFAGLLIDTMWTITYMGVNKITEAGTGVDPTLSNCNGSSITLSQMATTKILQTPFSFANGIFTDSGCFNTSGVLDLSGHVGNSIAGIELDLLMEALGIKDGCEVSAGGAIAGATIGTLIFPGVGTVLGGIIGGTENAGTCILGGALIGLFKWFIIIMWFIIVTIIIIITLFRIWFELLKAYVMTLLYVILGPLWIVFGLLPKRPLGFEKWLRVYFANLAVFPATVFLLVGARVMGDLFNTKPDAVFVPPLIGNPATGYLGAIIEFGMLLMAPQLMSIIREKLGTPPIKQFGQAMQTFNAGRGAAGAPFKKAWAGLNRRNAQTGAGEAVLSRFKDTAGKKIAQGFVGQNGIFGYKATAPNQKERWIDRVRREAVERQENLSAGHGRYTNEQRGAAPSGQQAAAQQQLSSILGTPGTTPPARYTSDHWNRTINPLEGHMTDEQRQHVAEGILRTNRGVRSADERDFLERQMRGNALTTDQRQRYERETQQARTGQATNIVLTIQPTGGGAPQTIPVTPGQTVRQLVMNMATPTSQAVVTQHLTQHMAPHINLDDSVETLSPQNRARLESFIGNRAGRELQVPPPAGQGPQTP